MPKLLDVSPIDENSKKIIIEYLGELLEKAKDGEIDTMIYSWISKKDGKYHTGWTPGRVTQWVTMIKVLDVDVTNGYINMDVIDD